MEAELEEASAGLNAQLARVGLGSNLPPLEEIRVGPMVIKLKPPSGSNYLRAAELSKGEMTLMGLFEALLCVTFINNVPEPAPNNRAMVDTMSDRLGRAGVDAVVGWYNRKMFPEYLELMDEGISPEAPNFKELAEQRRLEKTKKSQETQ